MEKPQLHTDKVTLKELQEVAKLATKLGYDMSNISLGHCAVAVLNVKEAIRYEVEYNN
jgi:predicted urease superfamily metal-dependent hydrolase